MANDQILGVIRLTGKLCNLRIQKWGSSLPPTATLVLRTSVQMVAGVGFTEVQVGSSLTKRYFIWTNRIPLFSFANVIQNHRCSSTSRYANVLPYHTKKAYNHGIPSSLINQITN